MILIRRGGQILNNDRNWTVLFIGGASGIGKSSIAYEIARFYGVNVLEVDDVHLSVETVTTKESFPAIHYWDTGVSWKSIGVEGNVNWLIDVSKEMIPILKALVERHLEDKLPIIIEGDFINPEFTKSFHNPEVKSIFVNESDKNQILQNYLSREGGDLQHYRAEISIAYGKWIVDTCNQNGITVIESRPWDTVLNRAIKSLL
jgi:2-phosphoglycerate kinase